MTMTPDAEPTLSDLTIAERERLAAIVSDHMQEVRSHGYVEDDAGWPECHALIEFMVKRLRDSIAQAWMPSGDDLATAGRVQLARFFGACLLDDVPPGTEREWLRNLHALYLLPTFASGPAILYAAGTATGYSSPGHDDAPYLFVDAPRTLSEDSVLRAITIVERVYRTESTIANDHSMAGPNDDTARAITQRYLAELAADARRVLDGDPDRDLKQSYRDLYDAESLLLHKIAARFANSAVDGVPEGAALTTFLLDDTTSAPHLGRSSIPALSLLAALAEEIAGEIEHDVVHADDDAARDAFLRDMALACGLHAHFNALALDGAALMASDDIPESWLRRPPVEPATIAFHLAAAQEEPVVSALARVGFFTRSSLIAGILSGRADIADTPGDRDALLCAARRAEMRAFYLYWFPRQVSTVL